MADKKIQGSLEVTGSTKLSSPTSGTISSGNFLGLDSNNNIIKGNLPITLGDIINLGTISVYIDTEGSQEAVASFSKEISQQEFAQISNTGLCIIMFNTTCVIIPYVKEGYPSQGNRFICNAAYDSLGNSMTVRGVLRVAQDEVCYISIKFNTEFAEKLLQSGITPYGIIRFIGLN